MLTKVRFKKCTVVKPLSLAQYMCIAIMWLSHDQNGEMEDSERDVYEVILTQTEIQDKLNEVNVAVAKEAAEAKRKLIESLHSGWTIKYSTT